MSFNASNAYVPSRTVAPVPWMDIPGVRAVIWALGRENVRFVGGCVRDLLARRNNLDVDMATVHAPEETLRLLQEARIRVKPIGIEHGTVVAITDSGTFEITSLRRDVETDGRRAVVAFTTDWAEDAARRDFTINAMSMAPDGRLYDPAGGIDDLMNGRVRFIGDPAERIREDVLRILRFYRITAWYGRAAPDEEGVAACAAAADAMDRLSGERVSTELRRLLAAPNPYQTVQSMADHRILRAITPLAINAKPLSRLVAIEQTHNMEPSPLCRLAVALPGALAEYRALAERLRFSNAEAKRFCRLARPLPDLGHDQNSIRRALYRERDREIFTLQALVAAVDGDRIEMRTRLHEAATWPWPEFPVNGLDMIEIGVPRGPTVGKILTKLEEWWMARDFAPDRATCLDTVRRALNQSP